MTTFTTTRTELSLRDMLADPIVQTMMARDGVSSEEVEGLFAALRNRTVGHAWEATRPQLSSRSMQG